MIEFDVPAMSCGHCVSTVTQTIRQVDPQAKVEVNLETKKVKVESSQSRASIAGALAEAGYPTA